LISVRVVALGGGQVSPGHAPARQAITVE